MFSKEKVVWEILSTTSDIQISPYGTKPHSKSLISRLFPILMPDLNLQHVRSVLMIVKEVSLIQRLFAVSI